jgi:GntR family transcriptional regulator
MAVSPGPLHVQVADSLRRAIATKELPPGAELPSEAQLCKQYDVSRITVRKALSTLEQEGLIVSAQGRPRRVRQFMPIDHHPMTNERLDQRERDKDSYVAEVLKTGREPTTSFTMRIEGADQEIATQLKIDADDLVCVRDVMRYLDDEPWSVQTSYYPMDITEAAGLATPRDIPQGTVRALADAGFIETGYVDAVTARMPAPEEARRLDVGPGTPILVHTRTAGTAERPTRVTRTILPTDRNRLVYKIDDTTGIQ